MKINKFAFFGGATCLLLVVGQAASANMINITTTDLINGYGPVTIVQGGPIAEKTTSQGAPQLLAWAQTEVGLQNNSSLPAVGSDIFDSASNPSNTGLNLSAYVGDYLVAHWGNGDAQKLFDPNPKGGFDQIFYITANGDTSLSLLLPELSGIDKKGNAETYDVGGLSFYRIYAGDAHVPDSGSTAAMFGFALVGLNFIRRKLNRN